MKKTLNATSITNELQGASLYFARERKDRQQAGSSVGTPESPAPLSQGGVPVPVSPDGIPRTSPVPPRRPIRQRQPFDVFEDQYRELKRIAEDERSQGLPGSMSRMVREAIDHYLAQHKR